MLSRLNHRVICNGQPCYWSVTEKEATACQTDWCSCPVDTSSLKPYISFFPHCLSTPLSFPSDTTLIVSGYSRWWTAVICKIDSPQELLQEIGKNNTESGLMKWFSPFLLLLFAIDLCAQMFDRKGKLQAITLSLSHSYNTSVTVPSSCHLHPGWYGLPHLLPHSTVSIKFTFKRQHHLLPKNSPTLTYLVLTSWLSLYLDQLIWCLLINLQ